MLKPSGGMFKKLFSPDKMKQQKGNEQAAPKKKPGLFAKAIARGSKEA